MQIFHPELDTELAVKRLDKSRAGNQCWRESVTLLNGGWQWHPAHKLKGNTPAELAWFCWYNILLIDHVWEQRWCKEATHHKWRTIWEGALSSTGALPTTPEWLAGPKAEAIVSSHRSCLLFKDPEWYGQFGWTEPARGPLNVHGVKGGSWPYVWPD